MAQVFMRCPETGKPVYVGLNMDWNELESFDPAGRQLMVPECPYCREEHRFQKIDLFLRADGAG
jgi:hypothetical protein